MTQSKILRASSIRPNPTTSGPRSVTKQSPQTQFIVEREEIILEYSGKERQQSSGVGGEEVKFWTKMFMMYTGKGEAQKAVVQSHHHRSKDKVKSLATGCRHPPFSRYFLLIPNPSAMGSVF